MKWKHVKNFEILRKSQNRLFSHHTLSKGLMIALPPLINESNANILIKLFIMNYDHDFFTINDPLVIKSLFINTRITVICFDKYRQSIKIIDPGCESTLYLVDEDYEMEGQEGN